MKKVILFFALAAGLAATSTKADAQISAGVNFNIGSQPLWGPTGYDYAGYYYMPDIDAYYDVNDEQFIYQDGGDWVYGNSLPPQYSNYDLYGGYKVVINESRPWMRNNYYRDHYYGYRGRHNQSYIRNSRDNRYYANVNHPYHNQWRGNGGYGYNQRYEGRGGYNQGYGGRGDNRVRREGNYSRGYDRMNDGRGGHFDRDRNYGGGQRGNGNWNNGDRGQGGRIGENRGNNEFNRGGRDGQNGGGRQNASEGRGYGRGNNGGERGGERGGRGNR